MGRNKILIVDDDQEIWSAYRSVLAPEPVPKTDFEMLTELLSETDESPGSLDYRPDYELTFISQGEKAYEHVVEQKKKCESYSVAFIDIRMPPGWNGIETAQKIGEIDSDIEIVIVTAYTDISRSKIIHDIGRPHKLLYLRKPFDKEELIQIALQLSTKWELYQQEQQQKKSIEQLLFENQQVRSYLDAIINSMPSMVIGVSDQGLITHWNAKIEDFTGIIKNKIINQPIEKVLPELEGIKSLISRASISSTSEKMEKFTFNYTNKGVSKMILCDIIVYPISVTEENSTFRNNFVIQINDITEKVKLEKIMLQSDKMLTVGGLAAGMAHEINTPLGSIIQNAQVITNRIAVDNNKNRTQAEISGCSMENIHDYLEYRGIIQLLNGIRECGSRTSKIVKSMLSFSHQNSSMRKENLSELVEEAIQLSMNDYDMKKLYHFRDYDFEMDIDPTLPAVTCERTKIEQVIMNLLKNSAQAMQDMPANHEPRIKIKISQQQDKFASIELEDNGPGISKKNQERIFDPFFTTKEVGVGTGLGLSLAYFIISKHHNGLIRVESEPGSGARFIIQIPLI